MMYAQDELLNAAREYDGSTTEYGMESAYLRMEWAIRQIPESAPSYTELADAITAYERGTVEVLAHLGKQTPKWASNLVGLAARLRTITPEEA